MADLKGIAPTRMSKTQLAEFLEEKYPNYKWERVFLLKGRFAQQKRLEKAVASLFQVGTSTYTQLAKDILYLPSNRFFLYRIRKFKSMQERTPQ